MKLCWLIFLLSLFCSCSAPISYVNSLPRSSGLEKEGDLNLRAGFGSDFKGKDQVFQLGGAWSPIQRLGVDLEYTGRVNLFGSDKAFDRLNSLNSSLFYYIPLKNRSSVELSVGYGVGEVNGSYFSPNGGNVLGNIFNSLFDPDFVVDSKFKNLSSQINYNFYDQSDHTSLSIGIRARKIHFDNYYYETTNQLITDRFDTFTLDPFFEMNNEIGKIIVNTRLSYSYFPNGNYFQNNVHPNFSKVGLAFGLKYRIASAK